MKVSSLLEKCTKCRYGVTKWERHSVVKVIASEIGHSWTLVIVEPCIENVDNLSQKLHIYLIVEKLFSIRIEISKKYASKYL